MGLKQSVSSAVGNKCSQVHNNLNELDACIDICRVACKYASKERKTTSVSYLHRYVCIVSGAK